MASRGAGLPQRREIHLQTPRDRYLLLGEGGRRSVRGVGYEDTLGVAGQSSRRATADADPSRVHQLRRAEAGTSGRLWIWSEAWLARQRRVTAPGRQSRRVGHGATIRAARDNRPASGAAGRSHPNSVQPGRPRGSGADQAPREDSAAGRRRRWYELAAWAGSRQRSPVPRSHEPSGPRLPPSTAQSRSTTVVFRTTPTAAFVLVGRRDKLAVSDGPAVAVAVGRAILAASATSLLLAVPLPGPRPADDQRAAGCLWPAVAVHRALQSDSGDARFGGGSFHAASERGPLRLSSACGSELWPRRATVSAPLRIAGPRPSGLTIQFYVPAAAVSPARHARRRLCTGVRLSGFAAAAPAAPAPAII